MDKEGSQKVKLEGIDNRHEVTAVVGASSTGARCHPIGVHFPEDWHIHVHAWHSPNHWANESTTLHYINEILKPAVNKIKQELCLQETQKCLLIWDVFRTHHHKETVLQKLSEEGILEGILCVFVPANCTSELQPMDV